MRHMAAALQREEAAKRRNRAVAADGRLRNQSRCDAGNPLCRLACGQRNAMRHMAAALQREEAAKRRNRAVAADGRLRKQSRCDAGNPLCRLACEQRNAMRHMAAALQREEAAKRRNRAVAAESSCSCGQKRRIEKIMRREEGIHHRISRRCAK